MSDFQAKAGNIRETCLALHLQRAARAVNRSYDEALRPTGLTINQFSLLVGLLRQEPPSLGQLAREMVMDRTTVTANLKPLESKGLVKSLGDPDDRRSRLLLLTESGRALLEQAEPLWRAAQKRAEKRLSSAATTYEDLRLMAGLHDTS